MRVCLAALLLLLVGCRAQCSAYLTCSDCYTSNGTFSCSWNPNTQTCVPPDPLDKSLMTSSQDCSCNQYSDPNGSGSSASCSSCIYGSFSGSCSKICRSTKVGTCQSTTNDCFNLTPGVKDAFKLASWIIAIIIITVILIIAVPIIIVVICCVCCAAGAAAAANNSSSRQGHVHNQGSTTVIMQQPGVAYAAAPGQAYAPAPAYAAPAPAYGAPAPAYGEPAYPAPQPYAVPAQQYQPQPVHSEPPVPQYPAYVAPEKLNQFN